MSTSLAAVALLAVLAGCGGGSTSKEQAQEDFGLDLGEPIQLADCDAWNAGSVDERLGTIREIRNFAGGPVGSGGGHGATLSDEDAYKLFERFCDEEFAGSFRLYKLYTRAASFGAEL